jgi:hypothetical protein
MTIISDSLEGLFLGCRYEVMAKLEAMNKCSQNKAGKQFKQATE